MRIYLHHAVLVRELRRAVCLTISVTLAVTPLSAWPRTDSQAAAAAVVAASAPEKVDLKSITQLAKEFGQQQNAAALQAQPPETSGSFTLPTGVDASGKPVGSVFSPTDLVPQENPAAGIHYGTTLSDLDKAASVYDGDAMSIGKSMDDAGQKKKEALYAETTGVGTPTVEGGAYEIMLNQYHADRPDMSGESWLAKSVEVSQNINKYRDNLGTCKEDSSLSGDAVVGHVPDLQQCTQVLDLSGTCRVEHRYDAGILEHSDGPYNIASCGKGCTMLWIGKVGDNYWCHSCGIFEETTQVRMLRPSSIIKAVIDYEKWDDHMQIWVGPPGKEAKVWAGPNNEFPPETPGRCELSTSWQWNQEIDVTPYFKNVDKNTTINFHIRTSVSGCGEGYARVKIYYDPNGAVDDYEWTPATCVSAAQGVEDGFATGTFRCTDMPQVDANGCVMINGATVCPENLKAPITGLSPLCRSATVDVKFDYYKGKQDCWTAVDGSTVCPPDNEGGYLDECQDLIDKGCAWVKTQCTEGAEGKVHKDNCYVNDVTYDCGKDIVVQQEKASTGYTCEGGIACRGTECIDTDYKVNTDFGKVTALMNAAQQVQQDMTCEGLDENGKPTGDKNVTCIVFSGKAGWCKKAVGGMQNCCKPIPGVGLFDYLMAFYSIMNLNSVQSGVKNVMGSVASSDALGSIAGSFSDLVSKGTETISGWFSGFSETFSSFSSNVSGMVKDTFDVLSSALEWLTDFKKTIANEVKDLMMKVLEKAGIHFGEAAGSTAGSSAMQEGQKKLAEQGASSMTSGLGTAVTVIGWVYTAYVVFRLAVSIIYKCEDQEYEMLSKKQLGSCHHVGSYCKSKVFGMCIEKRDVYCCYQSPLSRILNEQIKKQGIGDDRGDWGSPKAPRCGGVNLEDLDKVDWDRVDLTEWTNLLASNGILASSKTLTLENLTGSTSKLGELSAKMGYEREDASQRVLDRIGDSDLDYNRQKQAQSLKFPTGAPDDNQANQGETQK